MRVSFICCPFKTSFGAYGSSLKAALQSKIGSEIQWVASNCGCGDPMESGRKFQTEHCDYFQMPMPMEYKSKSEWKRRARGTARSVLVYLRAKRYSGLLDNPEVVHFQQVLNAYGSKAVFSWLKQPLNATRVITIHELDADQLERPEENANYNRADAVIVHCREMKDRLVQLKVDQEKIHVVLHGTAIPEPEPNRSRDGIVFYGGHKIMSGKGIDAVFKAMSMIRQQRPDRVPTLKIHGHYGTETPVEALRLAAEHGLTDHIQWLNQIPEEDVVRLYQESLVCLLPFTGSFAGLAASVAAACQLPVICTRKAGLPDHLGDAGIWVDENNPEQLAARIIELLDSDKLREEVGIRLLKRAQDYLCWDVVADQTLKIYQQAGEKRAVAARTCAPVLQSQPDPTSKREVIVA